MSQYTYIYVLVASMLVTTSAFAEGIYRWTDDSGVTHYGKRHAAEQTDDAQDISEQIYANPIYDSHVETADQIKADAAQIISTHVIKKSTREPIPITTYYLDTQTFTKIRLLRIVPYKQSLWFSSDVGLIEFNRATEQWNLFSKNTNLPGDTAYDIRRAGQRLYMNIYDWQKPNTLTNLKRYAYHLERKYFQPSKQNLTNILTRGEYNTENSDVLGNRIKDALFYKNKIWIPFTGDHTRGQGFSGGGVAALYPANKRGRQYTTRDGLAHSYCFEITSSQNNSVWVTHWEEERGLSVLHNDKNYWQVVKKSRNGIELGGVRIAAVDNYILIGQQRAFVIYDRQSKLAYELKEKHGIPGYIIADIIVDDDNIWLTAYAYKTGGTRSAGLVRIAKRDLPLLFSKLAK